MAISTADSCYVVVVFLIYDILQMFMVCEIAKEFP